MKTLSMTELWQQLEQFLLGAAPEVYKNLNPGASRDEIKRVAREMNVEFDVSCVECYSIHNGQVADSPGLFNAEEFLSLERMVDAWKTWNETLRSGAFARAKGAPSGSVKGDWYNSKWIPFTYQSRGDYLCLDYDPAAGGKKGQIIRLIHDDPERSVIAGSLLDFLNDFNGQILAGNFVYSAEDYGLVHTDGYVWW